MKMRIMLLMVFVVLVATGSANATISSLAGVQLTLTEQYPSYETTYQFYFDDDTNGYYVTNQKEVDFTYLFDMQGDVLASLHLNISSTYYNNTLVFASDGSYSWSGTNIIGYFTSYGVFQIEFPEPTVGVPSSITVPETDDDGSYTISWGASSDSGVTYMLEEATDENFVDGLRTAYSGPNTSTNITDRSGDTTYYYRIKATLNGYTDSSWRTGLNGCNVGSNNDNTNNPTNSTNTPSSGGGGGGGCFLHVLFGEH